MALMSAESQAAQQMPRLVVNIVVDQLRSDCMEAFSGMYGEKGFNRLLSEARVYGQVEYPFSQTDRASAVATLMSGATPYEHGIIASRWLDRATVCPKHSVDDPLYAPFGVSENGSAVNLAVSTLSDEMKVASGGKAYVYSVSPFREAAILSAGHAADGAFWISDQTGEWTGTSYYGKAPQRFSVYDATDPTTMRIHDDYYECYGVEYLTIDSIRVGVGDGSDTIQMASFPMKKLGRKPEYHERLKQSYYILQAYWTGKTPQQ